MIGVFLAPSIGKAGIAINPEFVIPIVTVVLLPAILVYIFKKRKTLNSSQTAEKPSEVGFVVDTFHELVAKLKEKEKELERLKAFAEEKAVSIEAYNENILQSVPSGVISIDNDMKIKSINQAAGDILGLNTNDVMDKSIMDVFEEPLIKLMKENKTFSRAEYQYATGDKRSVWLGITASELKDASGHIMGSIFVFTDLTDIKALQAQVELKERLSQLGEMSAGISHELRNSMSVISGYAKLLSKKTEQPNKPTVDAIEEEIKTMDKIISELLAFAKPTVLSMEDLKLAELIKDAAASIPVNNDAIKISIGTECDPPVKGDAVLLRQAFSNILINAAEAMPDGGRINIKLRCIKNKAEVRITDTGCGIPESIIRKIFLPFYTTKQKGFGLGLALVQKIIISHGGIVSAESREGDGSVFVITLPLV
jgi:PAS domain S-box-containing protein